jgi:glycosyltransferase involved in cell wall biosynthesis
MKGAPHERRGRRIETWCHEVVFLSTSDENNGSTALMFTVVIGTYNGAQTLGAALDALQDQVSEFTYEILVVNDASTDTTADIANRPGIRLINLERNQGHGHTLNVGLLNALGQYMAMMDDDCVPPRQWIQQLGIAWNSVGPHVTMVGGSVEPVETDTFNRRYVAFRRPLSHQEAEVSEATGFWSRLRYQLSPPKVQSDPHPVYFTVGANMSVRVDAAREAGGFTEAPGAGEEESLARPLRSRFGPDTVQLFPNIVMHHNFDESLRDTFRRSRSYGRAHGRNWVKDRDIPTFSPLPSCATLVAGVIAVLSPFSALVVFVLSPYVLYRRWFGWSRTSGSREAIVYPYVQACEDIANNAGFVQGVWRELHRRRVRLHNSPD